MLPFELTDETNKYKTEIVFGCVDAHGHAYNVRADNLGYVAAPTDHNVPPISAETLACPLTNAQRAYARITGDYSGQAAKR